MQTIYPRRVRPPGILAFKAGLARRAGAGVGTGRLGPAGGLVGGGHLLLGFVESLLELFLVRRGKRGLDDLAARAGQSVAHLVGDGGIDCGRRYAAGGRP